MPRHSSTDCEDFSLVSLELHELPVHSIFLNYSYLCLGQSIVTFILTIPFKKKGVI